MATKMLLPATTFNRESFTVKSYIFIKKKKKINIFLKLLYTLQNVKLYTCTTSYLKIYKCNFRNSFCHLLSLAFFCWCLQYKCPTVISHHILVPFTALSSFHSENILMEPFTVVVRDSSHIYWEIFQVGLQEMGFQQHFAPPGKV